MANVKVSVCMAYYNRSEYVLECVDSLLRQDYDSYEVIVVNDGSSDPLTGTLLDSIQDDRLTVIHQNNTGFVGAIRKAIDSSSGEYIAIQGAGDISLPERIKSQADSLDNDSQIGIVSCLFENGDFGGNNNGNRTKRSYTNHNITAYDFLSGANPFGHGEVMFRRDLYEKVGGYRPFFKFSQDLDLWLRMIDYCKVEIIQEYLYERRKFAKDGVSTDEKKLFVQKYLAEFSRQCYRDRLKYGRDLVDDFGFQAGLLNVPNKQISLLLASRIISSIRKGDDASVAFYSRFTKSAPLAIKFSIASLLIFLNKNKIGRNLINIVFKIYKSKNKTYS